MRYASNKDLPRSVLVHRGCRLNEYPGPASVAFE